MEFEILLIALLVAVITGIALNGFVDVIDRRAAHRINAAEEPARKLSDRAEERVGGALERLVPGYVRRIRSDLYWATFADSHLQIVRGHQEKHESHSGCWRYRAG